MVWLLPVLEPQLKVGVTQPNRARRILMVRPAFAGAGSSAPRSLSHTPGCPAGGVFV